jgi:hypothetical protein
VGGVSIEALEAGAVLYGAIVIGLHLLLRKNGRLSLIKLKLESRPRTARVIAINLFNTL